MFASYALTAILASVIILPTLADVVPNGPGPGDSFNTGQPCNISWAGDASSTTAWSNMTITLKTGQNLNMIYLDTVAVTQDGTKDGTFSWPCPAVTPNSAIYFYEFTKPDGNGTQWTTRFTIASETGQSTPPTETDANGIKWGTGSLLSTGSTTGSVPATTPASTSNAVRSTSDSPSSAPSSSGSSTGSTTGSSAGSSSGSSTSASASVSASAGSKASNNNSGAIGSFVLDCRVWQAAVALGASALAFTVLL